MKKGTAPLHIDRKNEKFTMKYTVILEKGDTSYGAFVPDLPGCIAVGDTKVEVLKLIKEAIEFHLESFKESGETIPKSHCYISQV